jgi:short-subunit dehydrogenase
MAATTIEGKRILLTGASSGIGRALAKRLGERGAALAIAARSEGELEHVADEIVGDGGTRPVVLVTDLSVRDEAARLAARAIDALGEIDVLINNAGGGVGGSIASVGDRDEGREAFEVNYWSPLALAAAIIPRMRARESGIIVNVTSGAQVTVWPLFGAYAATKAAFASATLTMEMELQGTGIRVVEVCPGPVDTAVQGETRLAPGIGKMLRAVPMGSAHVLATKIVRALERGDRRLVYPGPVHVGLLFPRLVRWRARRLWSQTRTQLDPAAQQMIAELVVRTGSHGDPIAREAREQWERARTGVR